MVQYPGNVKVYKGSRGTFVVTGSSSSPSDAVLMKVTRRRRFAEVEAARPHVFTHAASLASKGQSVYCVAGACYRSATVNETVAKL